MILDVSQIITNDGASKRIDGTVSPESFSFNGQDITFDSPIEITVPSDFTATTRNEYL